MAASACCLTGAAGWLISKCVGPEWGISEKLAQSCEVGWQKARGNMNVLVGWICRSSGMALVVRTQTMRNSHASWPELGVFQDIPTNLLRMIAFSCFGDVATKELAVLNG